MVASIKIKMADTKTIWARSPGPGGTLEELTPGSLVSLSNKLKHCICGFKMVGKIPENKVLFMNRHDIKDIFLFSPIFNKKGSMPKCHCNAVREESTFFTSQDFVYDKLHFQFQFEGRHGHDLLMSKYEEEMSEHPYSAKFSPCCFYKNIKEKLLFLGPVEHEKDFTLMVDQTVYNREPIRPAHEEIVLGKFLTPNKEIIYFHKDQIEKLDIVEK